MDKMEKVSWRVEPQLKSELEAAARDEKSKWPISVKPIWQPSTPSCSNTPTGQWFSRPATLVHVAGREGIADILTIDHDDFETYRFGRNRKFRIAPGR
jgi:hypothetical protein